MKEGLSGSNGWQEGRPVVWLTLSEIE